MEPPSGVTLSKVAPNAGALAAPLVALAPVLQTVAPMLQALALSLPFSATVFVAAALQPFAVSLPAPTLTLEPISLPL